MNSEYTIHIKGYEPEIVLDVSESITEDGWLLLRVDDGSGFIWHAYNLSEVVKYEAKIK